MQLKRMMMLRSSHKGQMPFAIVAVALLLLAGTYGMAAAALNKTENNIENIQDEMDSIGKAADETKKFIERGIGDIILDMSRETDTGSLGERFDAFDSHLAAWISFQFPMRTSGAVVTVVSNNIELSVGTLKAASADAVSTAGVMPSCFCADGTAEIMISTSAGSLVKEVCVSADSMSALPFLLENASRFEQSVTGPWSLVTQLMEYQLSALAQYRIMSGYGSMSEYGGYGTNDIITEDDVKLAYRIALSVAETTYLRTSSGGYDLSLYDNVDAAELLAFRNGTIEIDLGAVFAQTLAGIADSLVLKWLDYFMVTKLLDIAEAVSDTLKNAIDWLSKLFTGKEAEFAGDYIKRAMAENGIPESEYRYLLNGSGGTVNIPATEVRMSAGETVTVPGSAASFSYPNVDVLSWKGWDGFMSRYRSEHNELRETLRSIVNGIANGIAGSYGLGKVKVNCDPYDMNGFIASMSGAIREALDKQRANVEDVMESMVRSSKVLDPLYASMYGHMDSNSAGLFGTAALENSIRSSVKANITSYIRNEYGVPLDPSAIDTAVDGIMKSGSVTGIMEGYGTAVNEKLELFRGVLNSVEKNSNSIFKDIMVLLIRYGMDSVGLYPLIEMKMIGLVNEIAEYASVNPLAGIYELPGSDSFVLDDGRGAEMKEYVSLECDASLEVKVVPPTKGGENIHYVGLLDDREASYSSMFRIFVKADLTYRAESASPLLRMLGSYDASVSGTTHSEFDIAVAVMSGWALTGVTYEPSNTLIGDIIAGFLKLIEPLIKPLLEMIRMAKSILNIMTGALMRVVQFVGDILMKLYEAIMGPLSFIAELVSNILGKIFHEIITTIAITLGSQTFGIDIFGFRLEVVTDILGELKNGSSTTKLKMTLPVFGVLLSASLNVKKDKNSNFFFTGTIAAEADTWNLDVTIDPLMKVRKSLVEINGKFCGTEIHAVMPQAVQYEELEFRLSDLPGLGTILSNIPLPVPGLKGSIDAGFELKYNSPFVYGVVINEFEQNPPGQDGGSEWAELYNSTLRPVDMEGYRIVPSSDPKKAYVIHNAVLGPGERMTVTFPGQFLRNTNESLTLYDADGIESDATPAKNDSKNDNFTWQRETDASAKWVFKKGTKDAPNVGGKLSGSSTLRAMLASCVTAAAEQAFKEMGAKIIGPDGVALFLERTMNLTIEKAISMIADCVVSASIFIEIAVSDATGSAHAGIRFSLMLDREIVKDGLTWAVGQIRAMMNNIDNPTGMTPRQIVSDDVYFQTMIFARVSAPKILGKLGGTGVTAGLVISCNITALRNLMGKEGGTWKVGIGLVLEDIPAELVPMMKLDTSKRTDLWLFRMTLERSP